MSLIMRQTAVLLCDGIIKRGRPRMCDNYIGFEELMHPQSSRILTDFHLRAKEYFQAAGWTIEPVRCPECKNR